MKIKNISAQNLIGILDLFDSSEEEEKFLRKSKEKNSTYSVTIGAIASKYGESMVPGDHDMIFSTNTIWENTHNSSNEAFFEVYLTQEDIDNLKQVGIIDK